MRRVRFEIDPEELDEILDRVMPLLPHGVTETRTEAGRVVVSSVGHTTRMPTRERLEAAAERPLDGFVEEEGVPADWQQRRARTDVVVDGRLMLRSPDDPPPGEGMIDIVLDRSAGPSFGTGSHPTTRMCAALMLGLEAEGGLADIGCGLGTLAILAAKQGFAPVIGVDRDATAIEQAVVNAGRNQVDVTFELLDVEHAGVPVAPTMVVNAPPAVHGRVLSELGDDTRTVIVSGTAGPETDQVVAHYEQAGFVETARRGDSENVWSAVLLRRNGASDGV